MNPVHLWKPRLHEVAAGLIGSGDDEISYLAQARSHGFAFALGELIGLDADRQTLRLASVKSADGAKILGERELSYDTLVLALGSRVNDFGVAGVFEYCHCLDSPAQAMRFQRAFLEAAVRVANGGLDCFNVGIVGAGATGVELAAELHHAVHAMGRYGGLDAGERLKITLIDQAQRVLPATQPRTSDRAHAKLRRLGVDVRLGQGVSRVTADALHLTNGQSVPCQIKVWASGVVGHDVVSAFDGLTLSKARRIVVDEHLGCVGARNIFAIGDCAAASGGYGPASLPPTAQVAHQQAGYLAKALVRRAAGKTTAPFRFRPRGTLISLGENEAAGEIPALQQGRSMIPVHGAVTKLLYVSLFHMHRVTLHGWARALALFAADRLRGTTFPPVKLH